jgi:hypothetical protein
MFPVSATFLLFLRKKREGARFVCGRDRGPPGLWVVAERIRKSTPQNHRISGFWGRFHGVTLRGVWSEGDPRAANLDFCFWDLFFVARCDEPLLSTQRRPRQSPAASLPEGVLVIFGISVFSLLVR